MHDIAWDGYLFSQPDSAFYFAELEYDFAVLDYKNNHRNNFQSAQNVPNGISAASSAKKVFLGVQF